jgi:hypothetical protein
MAGKFEGVEGTKTEVEIQLDEETSVTIARVAGDADRSEYFAISVDTVAKGIRVPKPPPPPPKGKTLIFAGTAMTSVVEHNVAKGIRVPKPPPPPPKGYNVSVALNVFEPEE